MNGISCKVICFSLGVTASFLTLMLTGHHPEALKGKAVLEMQSTAAKTSCAQYNPETGNFEWVEKVAKQ